MKKRKIIHSSSALLIYTYIYKLSKIFTNIWYKNMFSKKITIWKNGKTYLYVCLFSLCASHINSWNNSRTKSLRWFHQDYAEKEQSFYMLPNKQLSVFDHQKMLTASDLLSLFVALSWKTSCIERLILICTYLCRHKFIKTYFLSTIFELLYYLPISWW